MADREVTVTIDPEDREAVRGSLAEMLHFDADELDRLDADDEERSWLAGAVAREREWIDALDSSAGPVTITGSQSLLHSVFDNEAEAIRSPQTESEIRAFERWHRLRVRVIRAEATA